MSDLLIKNMKKPFDGKIEELDRGVRTFHEAIEIPEHGDLVDRDILTDILTKEIRLRKDNADEAMLLKGVLYEIMKAPVALPKSGS